MIRNIRALFPNLIIEFNTNTLPEAIQSDADTLTHTLNATVSAVLADRKTAEDSYGLKQ
jgi:hypothetical protein